MMKIMRAVHLFLIFTISPLLLFSQNSADYLGVIKLNDSSFISFSMHLIESDGVISGFTVTDLGGDHETKSNITGSYSNKNNLLAFKETGIIYTKSEVADYDFCFIHFTGKLNAINDQRKISGSFKGLYSDGSSCIDGEIEMKGIGKIEKRADRIDRVIQKSKRIPENLKNEVSVVKTLDTLRMNILKEGQNLSLFSNRDEITLVIYDAGKVDGDRITVYLNEDPLLENYTVNKEEKRLRIPLTKEHTKITVHALNIGSISPNTAKVEIHDGKNIVETITSLQSETKTSFTIINKRIKQ